LEKEIAELKREESKLIQQIKAAAKRGNNAETKILAKSLVRIRQQITKITSGSAQLKGISTHMTVRRHPRFAQVLGN